MCVAWNGGAVELQTQTKPMGLATTEEKLEK